MEFAGEVSRCFLGKIRLNGLITQGKDEPCEKQDKPSDDPQ